MSAEKKYIVVQQEDNSNKIISFVPFTWKNRKIIKRDPQKIYDIAKSVRYTFTGDTFTKCKKEVKNFDDSVTGQVMTLGDELEEYFDKLTNKE